MKYLSKIYLNISEKGFIIREKSLELIDKIKERYKNKIEMWEDSEFYMKTEVIIGIRILIIIFMSLAEFYQYKNAYRNPLLMWSILINRDVWLIIFLAWKPWFIIYIYWKYCYNFFVSAL